jgi:lipoprotein-anchoring transpeptidase ErfK/SrfK
MPSRVVNGSNSSYYTYYRAGVGSKREPKIQAKGPKRHYFMKVISLLIIVGLAFLAYNALRPVNSSTNLNSSTVDKSPETSKTPTLASAVNKPATPATVNPCASNSLSELILVSISKQHLWACDRSSVKYSSPVVTGDEQYDDTLTPPGTYHIYAKQTNRTLTGSSELGNWDVFVHYWMPFLYNKYGAYGLHDATWRTNNQFGHVNINSTNASNGCVELPLATAAWLYNWDYVGTTVTIQS